MTDTVAERIATLGGVPAGTPRAVAERRSWEDYSLGRALVVEHPGALDVVYSGVNRDHREAIAKLGKLDPVSEDMLTGHLAELEQFQWFVRSHLESSKGELPTVGTDSEKAAARAAARARSWQPWPALTVTNREPRRRWVSACARCITESRPMRVDRRERGEGR
jgi:starvation-inducible DNA-binding protein